MVEGVDEGAGEVVGMEGMERMEGVGVGAGIGFCCTTGVVVGTVEEVGCATGVGAGADACTFLGDGAGLSLRGDGVFS